MRHVTGKVYTHGKTFYENIRVNFSLKTPARNGACVGGGEGSNCLTI